MKLRSLLVACGVLFSASSILAQSGSAPTASITGRWGSDGLTFLDLTSDGKGAVSGTAYWRDGRGYEDRTAIKTGRFDPKTSAFELIGEAKKPDGTVVQYVIEGKVDKNTVTGTYNFGGEKGEFTFTRL